MGWPQQEVERPAMTEDGIRSPDILIESPELSNSPLSADEEERPSPDRHGTPPGPETRGDSLRSGASIAGRPAFQTQPS